MLTSATRSSLVISTSSEALSCIHKMLNKFFTLSSARHFDTIRENVHVLSKGKYNQNQMMMIHRIQRRANIKEVLNQNTTKTKGRKNDDQRESSQSCMGSSIGKALLVSHWGSFSSIMGSLLSSLFGTGGMLGLSVELAVWSPLWRFRGGSSGSSSAGGGTLSIGAGCSRGVGNGRVNVSAETRPETYENAPPTLWINSAEKNVNTDT